ncbi:tetratricopeptide repeat protein [Pseudomonadota bacterium]
MKRFALITLYCTLASVLMCADIFAQVEPQDDNGVRQDSDNRWMTDGRNKRIPNANQIELYRRAAELGDASAQFKMALMYDRGKGMPQDYAEAVRWYRKSAEQGFVEAQYNLGSMYDSGVGVPQEYAEAVIWYRKAAEQGHASAQKNLAVKYGKGQGVPQSHAEAYVWLSIAAMSGNKGAIKSRDYAASNLSPEDLDAAQKRAANLFEEIQQRKE